MGFLGAGVGFLWAYALFIASWGDFGPVFTTFGVPLLAGCVIGLAGASLYPWVRKSGSTLLLAGGIVASPVSLSVVYGVIPDPGVLLIFGFVLAPSFLASALLFLAGLLGFPKSRHLIKTLHDGGWIP